ncbi:hypothetical protein [Kozakia baliensis]|uniref:hypothetical protein n=1 Tax=Kozakia baliensis TaxID=153496 RepID=UPI0011BEFF26|nr:hypothetical protein [Kozakia baliensis]
MTTAAPRGPLSFLSRADSLTKPSARIGGPGRPEATWNYRAAEAVRLRRDLARYGSASTLAVTPRTVGWNKRPRSARRICPRCSPPTGGCARSCAVD